MLSLSHSFRELSAKWRAVSKAARIRLRRIAWHDGFPILAMQSPALRKHGGIYLSAGIHGDEPAAAAGLAAWAAENAAALASLPVVIFPCLNPAGLVANRRTDGAGRDMNRLFHDPSHPVVAAIHRMTEGRTFSAALHLHEDYDAAGAYVYEIPATGRWAEYILAHVAHVMPVDSRGKIDGRSAANGIIRRRFSDSLFERIGWPEAVWLHRHRGCRSLTFETPSEVAFEVRVRAQVAAIEAFVRLDSQALTEKPPGKPKT